eukprot:TRINITY_DN663_c0_g1_i3.p1 TRINITY_DN663_c0_g1~~TRINITY_DN663_c0_g1_i3.p1  ORF type:complete len:328 (+),score=42.68 TRINITY_DN663_c0_g1_i3:41-1024(+)
MRHTILIFVLLSSFLLNEARTYIVSEKQENFDVESFWTRERRAAAKPARERFEKRFTLKKNKDSENDVPPFGTTLVDRSLYSSSPYLQIGKIYFVDPSNNKEYSCSGSAIGGNVVLTAGHCVTSESSDHGFVRNWVYIPGEYNLTSRYGDWPSIKFYTFQDWITDENFSRDVAFVTVSSTSYFNQTIADVTGYLEISTAPMLNDLVAAVGYSSDVFNGIFMSNTYGLIRGRDDDSNSPKPVFIISNLTTGSSGGPWIKNIDIGGSSGRSNLVVGITSYGYDNDPSLRLFSPYFDQDVIDLWTEAISISVRLTFTYALLVLCLIVLVV